MKRVSVLRLDERAVPMNGDDSVDVLADLVPDVPLASRRRTDPRRSVPLSSELLDLAWRNGRRREPRVGPFSPVNGLLLQSQFLVAGVLYLGGHSDVVESHSVASPRMWASDVEVAAFLPAGRCGPLLQARGGDPESPGPTVSGFSLLVERHPEC